MKQTNYSLFVLSDREQCAFDKFKNCDTAMLTLEEFKMLRDKHLVIGSIAGKSDRFDGLPESGLCDISEEGKNLRAYQLIQFRNNRKKDIRYWITTAIAVGALIISTIALILGIT